MREEFLRKLWLEVYLKAMELKHDPVSAANSAVKEAKKQFPDDIEYFDQELERFDLVD